MKKGQYNRVPLDALDAIVEHRMNGEIGRAHV